MENPRGSDGPRRYLRAFVCPPAYFARRKRWGAFVIHGFLYAYVFVLLAVVVATASRGHPIGAPLGGLFGALFLWLLSVAHVSSDMRAQARPRTQPPPSAWKPVLILLGMVAISVVLTYSAFRLKARSPSRDPGARNIALALLEARVAVEEAIQYQRGRGRNPGSLANLNAEVPGATIEEIDPWGRPWVLSPAFQDTRTAPNPGDLWICSRGPAGTGPCPPGDMAAYAGPLDGSVGYSARFGGWQGSAAWGDWRQVALMSPWVLTVGYLVAYPVYLIGALGSRIVRRIRRGTSSPVQNRARPALNALWGICLFGVGAGTAIPMVAEIGARAPMAKARTDTRVIADAVATYSDHMGSLPKALTDLTAPLTNSRGQTAGPFLVAIPSPPPGWTRYRYRIQADGTYTITGSGVTASGEIGTVTAPERETRQ